MQYLVIFLKGLLMGAADLVPGISGGTITSDGVTDMLAERLGQYVPFFSQKLSELNSELDSTTTVVDSSLTLNTVY